MMGAAMLKRHQFVWSLWALYRLVVLSITWGSQAQPLYVKCMLTRTAPDSPMYTFWPPPEGPHKSMTF